MSAASSSGGAAVATGMWRKRPRFGRACPYSVVLAMGQCGAVEPSYGLISRCVLTDFVIKCVDNRFQRWGVLPRLRSRSFSCIGHPRRSLSLSLNNRDDGIPPRLDQRRRENARELCSGHTTEWANPWVPGRSRFPSLSPSHPLMPSKS